MEQRSCERCAAMIPAERIEAVPDTRLCVQCSAEMGGEFTLYWTYERTSKEGSLKRNYGSGNVTKVRKRIKPKN